MLTALSTALSALNAQSTAIDVVGNNLANLNTTGYKDVTTNFFDLLSQTEGGGTTQVGMGVGTPTTSRVFSQGATQASNNPLDVAIQGSGFLLAQPAGSSGVEYTRDGNLTTDSNGNLQTSTGSFVQGWSSVNGAVNTTGPIGNIVVPVGALKSPQQSTQVSLTMNLDATATPPAAGQPNYSTSEQVYDSLGNAHVLDLYFTNTAPNTWTVTADLDGPNSKIAATVTGGSAGAAGTGSITFLANGTVDMSKTSTWAPLSITFKDTNVPPELGTVYHIGGASGALALNLSDGKSTSTLPVGNPTITQYAQTSAVSANSTDGNAATNLNSVSVANGGNVVATYSDGTQVTVGQLAMATFQNPGSLIAVGNNDYQVSGATSAPSIGLPGSGGRGQILGGSLEASTVDIATEFTNLLVYERGYQADSKVVTTADQINQDTIALITA